MSFLMLNVLSIAGKLSALRVFLTNKGDEEGFHH